MILVSFSSAEDALFNDVRKYNISRSQGTENSLFRFFFWHPVDFYEFWKPCESFCLKP